MRNPQVYFVDLYMMGPDFAGGMDGLYSFCEILQRHVGDRILIMALIDEVAQNECRQLKETVLAHWEAALAEHAKSYVPPAVETYVIVGSSGLPRKAAFSAGGSLSPVEVAIRFAKSVLPCWNCEWVEVRKPTGEPLFRVTAADLSD
jgi:hypothetical protein